MLPVDLDLVLDLAPNLDLDLDQGKSNTILDLVMVTILEKFLSPTVAIISVFETWKSRKIDGRTIIVKKSD